MVFAVWRWEVGHDEATECLASWFGLVENGEKKKRRGIKNGGREVGGILLGFVVFRPSVKNCLALERRGGWGGEPRGFL